MKIAATVLSTLVTSIAVAACLQEAYVQAALPSEVVLGDARIIDTGNTRIPRYRVILPPIALDGSSETRFTFHGVPQETMRVGMLLEGYDAWEVDPKAREAINTLEAHVTMVIERDGGAVWSSEGRIVAIDSIDNRSDWVLTTSPLDNRTGFLYRLEPDIPPGDPTSTWELHLSIAMKQDHVPSAPLHIVPLLYGGGDPSRSGWSGISARPTHSHGRSRGRRTPGPRAFAPRR
jgi:hypothetical protein